MATRKLVLGSAAILAGALIASVPGLAQQAELNQSSANAASSDNAAYDAAQANYNQAKAKYDAELRDYNNKASAYQKQRDEYAAKLNAYNNAEMMRDQARRSVVIAEPAPTPPAAVIVEEPTTTTNVIVAQQPAAPNAVVVTDPAASTEIIVQDPPDDFATRLAFANPPVTLWRLDRIDANRDLYNAPVVDAAGLPVGHFRRVEIKEPGYPAGVLTLNTVYRTISLPLEHFRFDPNTGVVIADMPANAIFSVPSGFPVG